MPIDIQYVLVVNGIFLVALALGIYGIHLFFKPLFERQDKEFEKYAKLRKDRGK